MLVHSTTARHSFPSTSTLDSESVSHFSKLSAQWWNPEGEFSLLHAMNPIRLDFMRQKLKEVGEWQETKELLMARKQGKVETTISGSWQKDAHWLEGMKALDVGCGGGLLSESLARVGANVTGVDASASNVEIAKLHAAKDVGFSIGRNQTPLYRDILAEDLLAESGPNQFDVVCAMEVIEHVKSPRLFLKALADLVKPGGHLFMSTIARTSISRFLTIFMAEDVLRLVTPGTHRYDQYVNPSELVDYFKSDIHWIGTDSSLPNRLQYETRGAFYIPGLGKWYLANRGMDKYGSQLSNYFFWARKPL